MKKINRLISMVVAMVLTTAFTVIPVNAAGYSNVTSKKGADQFASE